MTLASEAYREREGSNRMKRALRTLRDEFYAEGKADHAERVTDVLETTPDDVLCRLHDLLRDR